MLSLVSVLALQSAAFTCNVVPVSPTGVTRLRTALQIQSPQVVMILPKKQPGLNDPVASEEAMAKTKSRTAIVWAVVTATAALISSSGKSLDLAQAPGYTEQAAKKEAASKAYLEEKRLRMEQVKARAEAARLAGLPQTVPPKPWEKWE